MGTIQLRNQQDVYLEKNVVVTLELEFYLKKWDVSTDFIHKIEHKHSKRTKTARNF